MIRIGKPWLSLNEILGLKWTPFRRAAWSETFRVRAQSLLTEAQRWIPHEDKLIEFNTRVIFTRVARVPIKDYDNLVGGAKLVVDALKTKPVIVGGLVVPKYRTWGLYFDDSKPYFEAVYVQQKPGVTADAMEPGTYIDVVFENTCKVRRPW